MEDLKVVSYRKGETIFEQGARQETMFDIVSGKVGIYASYADGEKKLLTELTAGRSFGEMALLEKLPRSATAVALEDTELQEIREENLETYFSANPDKIYDIMEQMGRRIRELTEDYTEACRAADELLGTRKNGGRKSGWLGGALKKIASFLASSHPEGEAATEMDLATGAGRHWDIV